MFAIIIDIYACLKKIKILKVSNLSIKNETILEINKWNMN
jgi:hypothetical protein